MSDFNEMNEGSRWYVVHTYSGYENKVMKNLKTIIENRGMGHLITDIRIPVQIELEYDDGEMKETQSMKFPSYILVKMTMTDETWHVVRNIRGVTGFVGPGSKPVPLSDEEVEAVLAETTEVTTLSAGDEVDIVGGMFKDFSGTVESVSEDGEMATVIVKSIGNDMSVQIETKLLSRKK